MKYKRLLASLFLLLMSQNVFADSDWLLGTTLKQDLRIRAQQQNVKENGKYYLRNRERIRYRLGLKAQINEKLMLSGRLVSGTDDPRSTNQTLGNQFTPKHINLDEAYLCYKQSEKLTITAGKYSVNTAFFLASDLVWDNDISLEGQDLTWVNKPMDENDFEMFYKIGYFVLAEIPIYESDPVIIPWQIGFNKPINQEWALTFAYTQYTFENQNALSTKNIERLDDLTNSLSDDHLAYSMDGAQAGMHLTKEWYSAAESREMKMIIYADGIHNYESNDEGFLYGLQYGDKNLSKEGDWQIDYNYRRLERDAFLSLFPDSDSYDGKTDILGSKFNLKYSLGNDLIFGALIGNSNTLAKGESFPIKLVQIDLSAKF